MTQPSSMRAAWILAAGTVLVSVATSAVVVSVLTPDPREDARSGLAAETELRELRAELTRLREALEGFDAQALVAPVTQLVERMPLDAEGHAVDPGLASAIARLETTVREELQATRVSIAEGSFRDAEEGAPAARRIEIAWPDWEELWGVYQGDERTAADQVRLLTPAQVLARFGPPTTVRPRGEKGIFWYYYDESEGGQPLSVTLQIVDGFVADCWMEMS